jgi:uncharacterized membrane protein
VYAVIVGVLGVIVWGLAYALAPNPVTTYESYDGGFEYSTSSGLGAASIIVLILGYLVLLVVGAAIQSAFISGLLDIANGREVTIGSFFKPRNIGNVIVAGLIIAVLTGIGYLLCVIPGLAVALFSMFAIVALLDRNLSPIDAIKTSFEIVRNNFGSALLTWLVMTAIVFAGALVCYVGLLVALPVAGLFLVYTYRSLIGGQVAPLTP